MSLALALATLTRATCYEHGAILPLGEVERRIAEQRNAVVALGLGVPSSVLVIDPEADAMARTERRLVEAG